VQGLIGELSRRNVFRVAVVYLIAGWIILQVADIVFPALGLPDWTITFVIALLGIGFPVAVIFAWAFELTPDGLMREKDVDRTQSATPATGRRIDKVIIVLLVLGIGYFALDKFFLRTGTAPDAVAARDGLRSIAVLPLVNMSDDPANEYFSDGLADTLLHMLAQVKDLRVAARTSSFAFKGQNKDVRSIGEELNVETILEGSVQRSADRVRITVQLINTKDGYHLWSETYDRDLDDIFAVQDEIAAAIADALQVTLGTVEQEAIAARGTDNIDAYELYLLGRHDWASRGFERLKRAQQYFEDAVEEDPNFAMAWVGLANTLFVMPWYDKDAKPDDGTPRAKEATERALELDPKLGEAYATLASIAHEFELDFDKSERLFEKAIELNPNHATTWHWYCNLLQSVGRPDEALEACTTSVRLDPLSPIINLNYAAATWDAGDRGQSLERMEHTVELDPDWPVGVHGLAIGYLQLGRYGEAADTLERWAQIRRYPDPSLARTIIAGVEEPEKREAALSALEKMVSEDRASAFMSLIQFYGLLGDIDSAWAIIEQGVEARHPNVAFLGTAPGIDSLREDPRLIALMEELGVPNGGRAYRQRKEGSP